MVHTSGRPCGHPLAVSRTAAFTPERVVHTFKPSLLSWSFSPSEDYRVRPRLRGAVLATGLSADVSRSRSVFPRSSSPGLQSHRKAFQPRAACALQSVRDPVGRPDVIRPTSLGFLSDSSPAQLSLCVFLFSQVHPGPSVPADAPFVANPRGTLHQRPSRPQGPCHDVVAGLSRPSCPAEFSPVLHKVVHTAPLCMPLPRPTCKSSIRRAIRANTWRRRSEREDEEEIRERHGVASAGPSEPVFAGRGVSWPGLPERCLRSGPAARGGVVRAGSR